jgi:hypothetical protein
MTPAETLRTFLYDERLSPDRLGPTCTPPITGQSIRGVLRGRPAGAKVARALASRVPGLEVADLIAPPRPRKQRRVAA